LDLRNNKLASLPTATFSNVAQAANAQLDRNCIDTALNFSRPTNLSGGTRKTNQKACPIIVYSPATATSGNVVGTVVFTGGSAADRATLNGGIPITHTWLDNGEYVFDLSSMANAGLLLFNSLTGFVDWIIVPTTIYIMVAVTEANQTVTLNKYFANAFTANR